MHDDTLKVNTLITISNRYRTEKVDYNNAKSFAQQGQQLAEKLKFKKGVCKASIAFAYATRDMGQHEAAINLLHKVLQLIGSDATLLKDPSVHITHVYTYTAIADLYTYLPNFVNAEANAFKAIQLAEKYNVGIGQCWLTISIIFSKQKNLAEAEKYGLKALDYFQTHSSLDDLARTYAYLARYAYTAQNFTKAIDYYKQSFETYKRANSISGQRIALYNLAEIHLKMKSYAKADYYINETLNITREAKDVIYLFFINQLKFNIDFDSKHYLEALRTANLLLDLATKERNLTNISSAYQNLLSVYKATNDTANAYKSLEKITALKDSIYNVELAKNSADLLKKYEAGKQEEKIKSLDKENAWKAKQLYQEHLLNEALQRENDLQEKEIEQSKLLQLSLQRENKAKATELRQKQQLNLSLQQQNDLMNRNSKNEQLIKWLMICSMVVFGVFAVGYYRNYIIQKKANAKIANQANQLKVLMKEVHHRVKNNLQVIAAILRMQARSINDVQAINALKNCEQRLQSIAFVHEKMYQSEQLNTIDLKDYLSTIVNAVDVDLKHLTPDITVHFESGITIITNLETAMPLGIIVNELVTNAYKYAFNGIVNPILQLQLSAEGTTQYKLEIRDNGIGLPGGTLEQDRQSLGLKLVTLLAEQLGGQLQYVFDSGSVFTLHFKNIQRHM